MIAVLHLSGERVEVDALPGPNGDGSISLDADALPEAIHFSPAEARMLIAALLVAVETVEQHS